MIKLTKEDQLINHIRKLSKNNNSNLIKSIGDDAAVFHSFKKYVNLVTVDTLVESVHFLSNTSEKQLAHKAIAVNISDIAAMSGTPIYALISLTISEKYSKKYIYKLTKELSLTAEKYNVIIIGGDTVKGPCLSISVTMFGIAKESEIRYRHNAEVGDKIYVTGKLGGSFKSGKHLLFTPRINEAKWLRTNCKLNAMMDLSDGLIHDAQRMAIASNVTINFYSKAIPINSECSVKNLLIRGYHS